MTLIEELSRLFRRVSGSRVLIPPKGNPLPKENFRILEKDLSKNAVRDSASETSQTSNVDTILKTIGTRSVLGTLAIKVDFYISNVSEGSFQEEERTNKVKEAETYRSNVATEGEIHCHNKEKERLLEDSNKAREYCDSNAEHLFGRQIV